MSVRRMFARTRASPGSDFLARDAVPVAVAGRGQRVDRVHLALPGPQDGDQEAARGLDRDRDRVLRGVAVFGEQVQQDLVAVRVVGDVPLGQ
jgi:hypothetical protein